MVFSSCSKNEQEISTTNFKIKEYVPVSREQAKNEAYEFLDFMDIRNNPLKIGEVLTPKYPNEAMCLMEAGLNYETNMHLDKEFEFDEKFEITVSNFIDENQELKMDLEDMSSKYNAIKTEILSKEDGSKFAHMVDLEIESITTQYTKLKVYAMYGNPDRAPLGCANPEFTASLYAALNMCIEPNSIPTHFTSITNGIPTEWGRLTRANTHNIVGKYYNNNQNAPYFWIGEHCSYFFANSTNMRNAMVDFTNRWFTNFLGYGTVEKCLTNFGYDFQLYDPNNTGTPVLAHTIPVLVYASHGFHY